MRRYDLLLEGEYYHVYNRGAHKQDLFLEEIDYRRFQLLLHILNTSQRVVIRDLLQRYRGRSSVDIFHLEHTDHALVDIMAYCLMPNHFHLILRQKSPDGISIFMKKLATAYAMYYNLKYEHSGVLFQGRFKSKHVGEDAYFRWLFSYVHLNSIDLVEPGWKEKGLQDMNRTRSFVNTYPYSSFVDYLGPERPERALLAYTDAPEFVRQENDLELLIRSLAAENTKDRPL
ncbi:MAG: transposase [Candidatus Micrarchaeaceae archaeon]